MFGHYMSILSHMMLRMVHVEDCMLKMAHFGCYLLFGPHGRTLYVIRAQILKSHSH